MDAILKITAEALGAYLATKILKTIKPDMVPDDSIWVSEKTFKEIHDIARQIVPAARLVGKNEQITH